MKQKSIKGLTVGMAALLSVVGATAALAQTGAPIPAPAAPGQMVAAPTAVPPPETALQPAPGGTPAAANAAAAPATTPAANATATAPAAIGANNMPAADAAKTDAAKTATPAAAGAPAGAAPAPTANAAAGAAPATGAAPTAAEMAIIQNAGVLNTLAPANPAAAAGGTGGQGMKVTDILAQPATVRPLPEKYLVVKKERNADDADSRLTAARMALWQGNYQAALELFDDLYKRDSRDIRVAMGRAVALQKLGQTDEALSAYQKALSTDPKNVEALTNMLGLIKGQDTTVAISKLKQLREMYPANADVAAQLGMVYGVSGDYENAIKYLDMAEVLKPGSAVVLYNKAVAYDRMGRTTEAADLYRKIVRMAGDGSLDQVFPLDSIRKRLAVLR